VTLIAVAVFIVEISATVTGQLLLKRAMEASTRLGFGDRRVLPLFIAGVGSLTVSFFLTIALLEHFDLSFFYPIQGSTVVIITMAAVVILRERLTAQILIGSILISSGIVLVSLS
jgi:drug/metabolite transporter (DMT)-like permease